MVIRFLVSTSSSPASSAAVMHSHKLIIESCFTGFIFIFITTTTTTIITASIIISTRSMAKDRHLLTAVVVISTTNSAPLTGGLTRTTITEPCRSTAQQSAEPVLPARLQECKRGFAAYGSRHPQQEHTRSCDWSYLWNDACGL